MFKIQYNLIVLIFISLMYSDDTSIQEKLKTLINANEKLTGILNTIKDINEVLSIKRLVETNIDNNKTILKQLEKSLSKHFELSSKAIQKEHLFLLRGDQPLSSNSNQIFEQKLQFFLNSEQKKFI